jgi:hypothetical protein
MKARDLAALAALGIAGKMAYDKFGRKKDDEPKSKGKLGEAQSANDGDAGESEARMSKRDMNEGSGRRDAGGNTETRSRQELDIPEALSRQERDVPDRVSSSGGRKTDIPLPAGGGKGTGYRTDAVTKKDTVAKAVVPRSNEDYSNEGRSSKAPVTALDRLNEANGAASESARKTDALAVGSRANQAAYLAGKQNDQMAAAGSPSALATDALAVGSRANQAAYLKQKQDQALVPDYSNEGRNRAPVTALSRINETGGATSPSARATDALAVGSRANQAAYKQAQLAKQAANAQAQARMMRQGSPMAASRRNAGMPGYDEAGNPISMRSMAGRPGYDEAGNKMNRGGAVRKMASGGMTSSRMSKPSGASRGDGIAQRGRTRGTLR